MKRVIVLTLCVVALPILVAPLLAQNHFYWPIEEGNDLWFERTDNPNVKRHHYSSGMAFGAHLYYQEHLNDGVLEYTILTLLTMDNEGDVWLHGGYDEDLGLWFFFEPSILLVDAPLYVGKTWETYAYSPQLYQTWHAAYEVVSEEIVTVPCGTFPTFQVRLTGVEYNTRMWLCDGVGMVQLQFPWGATFVLLEDPIIPVEEQTWGGVKALYR
jgi:hypothetical protein